MLKTSHLKEFLSTLGMAALFTLLCIVLSYLLPMERIHALISEHSLLSALLYLMLFGILPIFFFPVPILVLPAGMAFGLYWGSLYTLIAVAINSSIMFLISRYALRGKINRFLDLRKHKARLSAKLYSLINSPKQKNLFICFFILRLIPLISYNLINYLGGLSRISFKNYLLSTLLGAAPGIIVFINTGEKSLDPYSKDFLVSLCLLLALCLLSSLLSIAYMKHGQDLEE